MELLNATSLQAGYTLGLDPDGRERLVVVAKGTFTIPAMDGGSCMPHPEPAPLIEADVFADEPGLSAPLAESDYAPFKPKCDVLLNGSAYAPKGRQAHRIVVSLKVGSLAKSIHVVGDRIWKKRWFLTWLCGLKPSSPQPFTSLSLTYDKAFGGADCAHKNPKQHRVCEANPIGRSFFFKSKNELIKGSPLPNLEDPKCSIKQPRKPYPSVGFGIVGRNWLPRRAKAGTYDEAWMKEQFPFLPLDFDPAYHQAAPPDQQCEYLKGGEEVVLINLTPQEQIRFKLPIQEVPVVFFLRDGSKVETHAVLDTLLLEPDLERFMLTWRTSLPLKRNIFEVSQVLVGKMPKGWWRARELGKTYHRSLSALIKHKCSCRKDVSGEGSFDSEESLDETKGDA